MRFPDRTVLHWGLLSAVVGTALSFATNLASNLVTALSTPAQIAVWTTVTALTGVAGALAAKNWPRTGSSLDEVAERLRNAVGLRWENDPIWRSVQEAGRLPTAWRPAGSGWFEANASLDAATGKATTAPGEALAGLWVPGEAGSKLVVLGDGGSGKTELLVETLRFLLTNGRPGDPVPVLVPLASWDPRQRLRPWLVDWIRANYRFLARASPEHPGRNLAEAVLAEGRLALMLDGFDEIAPEFRTEALRQINELPGCTRTLLSSRPAEYRAAVDTRARANPMRGARGIVLLPQPLPAVTRYLACRSDEPGRWSRLLTESPVLARTVRTPLMVMLVNSMYNHDGRAAPDPDELRRFGTRAELEEFLLAGFLPARYPAVVGTAWTATEAGHWLSNLARMAGGRADLRWWELDGRASAWSRPAVADAVMSIAVLVWTALSAGLLNGWLSLDPRYGFTDGVRISGAALVCYLAMRILTTTYGAAVMGAVGAYVAGTLSGSYDLGVGVGLITGFSWRPLPLKRSGPRSAVLVTLLVVAVPVAIRAASRLWSTLFTPGLTRGFAAGALDGFVNRWDEDVNGWLATGLVAGIIVWTAVSANSSPKPLLPALAVGGSVAGIDCWADGFRAGVTDAWLLGPADGLAAGFAVWYVTFWAAQFRDRPHSRGTARPVLAGALLACLGTGLNFVSYRAQTDISADLARAAAEGLCLGVLLWIALTDRRAPATRMMRTPLTTWLRIAAPAAGTAGAVAVVHGLSSGVARGIATGLGIGTVVLFALCRRHRPGAEMPGPAGAGVFALVVVGIVAGFGYGLLFGLAAGLGSRVSRAIWQRGQPSRGVVPSWGGAVGGAAVGTVTALAAAFNGMALPWLVITGLTSAIALSLTFGIRMESGPEDLVASPRTLFRRDRRAFFTISAVVATALGFSLGSRTIAGGGPWTAGVLAAVTTTLTFGTTTGLVIAAATTRYGVFAVTVAMSAARGDLPWRLMRFLHDAHVNRGVLRSNGESYQFRHERLRHRIARDHAATRAGG
ncbi:NACHT domain-containing protein [Paractinoplanes toevensis]|uniref:NACHT domain-containing protein n=1 Tax=Paractinoplanes toevensis TaxID=571911 RepID=A0A919W969_9ACTN|nr:hypothetical protein [Actinoplanes toevensis]GIM95900.1 hypothetical protein Ato02nite_076930 [Actinoplanes toevensis]